MLSTKDAAGFLRPLAPLARSLRAVSIPGEAATLTAERDGRRRPRRWLRRGRAGHRRRRGRRRDRRQPSPDCRILICGSLYLAGRVLRENG